MASRNSLSPAMIWNRPAPPTGRTRIGSRTPRASIERASSVAFSTRKSKRARLTGAEEAEIVKVTRRIESAKARVKRLVAERDVLLRDYGEPPSSRCQHDVNFNPEWRSLTGTEAEPSANSYSVIYVTPCRLRGPEINSCNPWAA